MGYLVDTVARGWRHVTRRPRRTRDRGAATTVATILMGGGVLMGAGAIVMDVGQLYVERQELQGGADAAALALAQTCAKTPTACATQAARAADYANRNAADGHARITAICGTGRGLPACQPATGGELTRCVGTAPSGPYVEVRTETETADGRTVLPASFAAALQGNEGYRGSTVAACARAVWGTPTSVNGVAVTMSYCAWNQVTANGTKLAPPVNSSMEGVIYLHGSHNADTCAPGNSGWQAPGGFGWLDELAGPCAAIVPTKGTFGGSTGVSASGACQTKLANARAAGTVLWMPIFDGVRGTGSGIEYQIRGVSAFVVTGYSLSGFQAKSTLSNHYLCSGSDKCIYGYFTTGVLPVSSSLTDTVPNYGVNAASLAG